MGELYDFVQFRCALLRKTPVVGTLDFGTTVAISTPVAIR